MQKKPPWTQNEGGTVIAGTRPLQGSKYVLEIPAESGVGTHRMTPAQTAGLLCSKGTFQPYNPVPPAMSTDSQPSASRTSVCVWICLKRSGRPRNCKGEHVLAPALMEGLGYVGRER